MYIDYVLNVPSGADHDEMNLVFADLAGIFDGSITDKSQFNTGVCNISLSEFAGVLPDEYDKTSVFYDTAADGNDNIVLKFTKSHEQANATFDYKRQVGLYWEYADYGLRMVLENPTVVGTDLGTYAADRAPGNQDIATMHGHGGSNGNTTDILDFPTQIERIRIYVTKSYVIFQWVRSIGGVAYTFGMFDKEANAFDEAAYALDSTYAPIMYMSDLNTEFANPNLANNFNPQSNIAIGTVGSFLRRDGTLRPFVSEHYTFGTGRAPQQYHPYFDNRSDTSSDLAGTITINPTPSMSIGKAPISGIDSHIVLPVFATAAGSSLSNVPPTFFGQIPRFYRTTNDIAIPGTTITESGIDYVVLTWHKVGFEQYNNGATENGCYLVPKTAGDA